MADSFVRVPADSTGKKVDASELTVGADTVQRQRVVIGDNAATAEFATVTGGILQVGGVVNLSATAIVAGNINISATAQVAIGTPIPVNNISRTVQVAVGTPFTINNISATSIVAGVVGLTAGTAVIGALDFVSRTVQVAIGTPFTVNNVSATVTVAGVVGLTAGTANIGFINNISATVVVAGVVALTAGTANIGFINNISATVTVAGNVNISATAIVAGVVGLTAGTANIGRINDISATVTTQVAGYTPAIMSASHGPKCIIASTSASVTLIASPGAGQSVHITMIAVSNSGTVGSRARIGTSASASTIQMYMASAGGGFVMHFDPPWKLSASEAALCSVKPNTSEGMFNVNYFVAP